MSEEQQPNSPATQGPNTTPTGSAGQKLDQLISSAKRFQTMAGKKAKELADAAAPKLREISRGASTTAKNTMGNGASGNPLIDQAIKLFKIKGDSGHAVRIYGVALAILLSLFIILITKPFHKDATSLSARSKLQDDRRLASPTTAFTLSTGGDAEQLAQNAVQTAIGEARTLIPKVSELNERFAVLVAYKNRIKSVRDVIHQQLKEMQVTDLESPGDVGGSTFIGDQSNPEYVIFNMKDVIDTHKTLLVALTNPAMIPIRGPKTPTFDRNVMALKQTLASIGDPDAAMANFAAINKLGEELGPKVLSIFNSPFILMPMPSVPAGLIRIAGETHLIDGTSYYVDNHVVSSPTKYKPIYIRETVGPNDVLVIGEFKFRNNGHGTNAFGTNVNVELYECDPGFSDSQLRAVQYMSSKSLVGFAKQIGLTDGEGKFNNQSIASILKTYGRLFGESSLGSPSNSSFMRAYTSGISQQMASAENSEADRKQHFAKLLSDITDGLDRNDFSAARNAYNEACKLSPDDLSLPLFTPCPVPSEAKRIVYLCEDCSSSMALDVGWDSVRSLGHQHTFGFVRLHVRHTEDVKDSWSAYTFTQSLITSNDMSSEQLEGWSLGHATRRNQPNNVDLGGIKPGIKAALDLNPDLLILITGGNFPKDLADVELIKSMNAANVRIEVVEPYDLALGTRAQLDPLLNAIAVQSHGFVVKMRKTLQE